MTPTTKPTNEGNRANTTDAARAALVEAGADRFDEHQRAVLEMGGQTVRERDMLRVPRRTVAGNGAAGRVPEVLARENRRPRSPASAPTKWLTRE
jgi:hypothetical protein